MENDITDKEELLCLLIFIVDHCYPKGNQQHQQQQSGSLLEMQICRPLLDLVNLNLWGFGSEICFYKIFERVTYAKV